MQFGFALAGLQHRNRAMRDSRVTLNARWPKGVSHPPRFQRMHHHLATRSLSRKGAMHDRMVLVHRSSAVFTRERVGVTSQIDVAHG